MTTQAPPEVRPPFWRDERIIGWISQLVTLGVIVGILYFLWHNMVTELRVQRDTTFTFRWINFEAGFDISESLIDYDRARTYGRAIVVGILNTLQVAVLGIVFATVIGVVMGVLRQSTNYLVRGLATAYVEIFRNIPLVILLIFWYQAIFLKLPRLKEAILLPGPIFISIRGVAVPWGTPTESWGAFLISVLIGLALAVGLGFYLKALRDRTGKRIEITLICTGAWLLWSAVSWFVLPQPLTLTLPYLDGLRVSGGHVFSPEFMSVLSAISIYTSAYVAENVRGGIMAVARGQYEASESLGLTRLQAMRLVILPQALRVIIPPMVSIYLGLTKNSSLAVAIGYPDFFHTTAITTLNQTGRAIEIFLLLMGVYLLFSLITSLILNIYNRRVQLVER